MNVTTDTIVGEIVELQIIASIGHAYRLKVGLRLNRKVVTVGQYISKGVGELPIIFIRITIGIKIHGQGFITNHVLRRCGVVEMILIVLPVWIFCPRLKSQISVEAVKTGKQNRVVCPGG